MKKAAVHIGCSGVFSTVETNNTFYILPAESVFRTHMKKLKDAAIHIYEKTRLDKKKIEFYAGVF